MQRRQEKAKHQPQRNARVGELVRDKQELEIDKSRDHQQQRQSEVCDHRGPTDSQSESHEEGGGEQFNQ